MTKPYEKYGLFTATTMVIGSVIGSGVFFKAELICRVSNGNGALGIIAWFMGGASMLLCLLSFSRLAGKYGSAPGLVGIAKNTVGESYSYYVGWFMATVYYPSLVSILAWLSARYTLLAFGAENSGSGLCMLLSCIYLVISFAQNSLFPGFSGKFQIITTVLKLIPLILMIVFGISKGISSTVLYNNLTSDYKTGESLQMLFSAITASIFAYEGWIAVSGIGKELKNSRRNLPVAMILGGTVVILVYVLYFMGILGAVNTEVLINYGHEGIKKAFSSALGNYAAELLLAFVAVSCIGALNGIMMGCGRAMYAVSVETGSPAPKLFSQIAPHCNMPLASFVSGLFLSMMWLFFLFGTQISEKPMFSSFSFDSSEMPVVTIYALYIPMFSAYIKENIKSENPLNIIISFLGICACLFIIACAVIAHRKDIADYLFAFTAIMLFGFVFRSDRRKSR